MFKTLGDITLISIIITLSLLCTHTYAFDKPIFLLDDEICDNGIDDDGDGLIDCYDPDCCENIACENIFYDPCVDSCWIAPLDQITLNIEWQSEAVNWHPYNTPIAGDIDGDGEVEIIGNKGEWVGLVNYKNLLVINGEDGTTEAEIETPWFAHVGGEVAIADVDNNGRAEIFVYATNLMLNPDEVRQHLLCYEFDGTSYQLEWVSDKIARKTIPRIADFNQDGIPEVYLGNSIFNSLTGKRLITGEMEWSEGDQFSIAADVLPDNACLNCEGLELIAGDMVLAVYLDPDNINNNELTIERQVTGEKIKDGVTSIADMDLDGDLDAVVTSSTDEFESTLFIWDLQTNELMGQYTFWTGSNGLSSLSNLMDIDDDGYPEIGVSSYDRFLMLDWDKKEIIEKWTIDTKDWSSILGSTIFDFDNNGRYELLHRDEEFLRIIDAASGKLNSLIPCQSNTAVEYPTIVDIDHDNEAEILCSCDNQLIAFGSSMDEHWAPARPLWNQYSYFYTHVNDDLTIPTHQQSAHLPVELNKFMNQYSSVYVDTDLSVSLPEDITIEQGEEVELLTETNATKVTNYDWSPLEDLDCEDCPAPNASPDFSTIYVVTITDDLGCIASDSIHIDVLFSCTNGTILLPNAITPDGDGLNDDFGLLIPRGLDVLESNLLVFDRWGTKVFDGRGLSARWDGTYNGKPVRSDVYAYLLIIQCPDGTKQTLSGDLTVIR